MKIVHLTSVHQPNDIRIFHKECKSLAKADYDVVLVAPHERDEVIDGVQVRSVPRPESRWSRMCLTVWRVYRAALQEDAALYHFHDPELIPCALLLRMCGKLVVYDAHEDLPRQILGKHYLKRFLRPVLSKGVEAVENFAARRFSAICTATPYIRDRFSRLNSNSIDINNFPSQEELSLSEIRWSDRQTKICYVGGIAEVRGIMELLDAIADIDVRLDLAGNFSPHSLRERLVGKPGWHKVNELGFIDRIRIKEVLATCKVGIITCLPLPNYVHAQPIKMFEYMAAGIPVVASDFPLWREIVEGHNCGLCVDPTEPVAIAKAINSLLGDDEMAATMGENGRKAVEKIFNWGNEEKKLVNLYRRLTWAV